MSIVIMIPVILITIIVIPGERMPWMPVTGIITPVPGRVPNSIGGKKNEIYQGP
jgi:hypothetical protein